MGRTYDALHAADLVANLPPGSALLALYEETLMYSVDEYLLHGIMSMLAGTRIPYPWQKPDNGIGELASMRPSELMEYLYESNWKEVDTRGIR